MSGSEIYSRDKMISELLLMFSNDMKHQFIFCYNDKNPLLLSLVFSLR